MLENPCYNNTLLRRDCSGILQRNKDRVDNANKKICHIQALVDYHSVRSDVMIILFDVMIMLF